MVVLDCFWLQLNQCAAKRNDYTEDGPWTVSETATSIVYYTWTDLLSIFNFSCAKIIQLFMINENFRIWQILQ